MRYIGALCLLLGQSAVLGAPGGKAVVPLAEQEKASQFAFELIQVADQISTSYVQPVPASDLIAHALTALYESAHMSVPANLKSRLEKTTTNVEKVALIRELYVKIAPALSADGRNPRTIALKGMMRRLDPYSGIVSPEDKRSNIALESELSGVGLDLADYGGVGPFVVKAVYPGGPAQRAGIRPGELITEVDGEQVEKSKKSETLKAMLMTMPLPVSDGQGQLNPRFLTDLGPKTVAFRRASGPSRTVPLRNENFQVETVLGINRDDGHRWHYWADPAKKIAYVRIAMLGYKTPDELAEVLRERLLTNGMRGLILDLRWTPGGWLDQSVDVARFFLGDVPIATIKSRQDQDSVFRGGGPGQLADLPLVVLVNGDTMGGAELIAAALQDHKRAVIVGQRTRGKGSVQRPFTMMNLPVKLTTGTFLRPSGKNLHRFPDSKPDDDWGVIPDVDFRVSADLSRQLKQWWEWQTLRPGPSMERLPLDDPMADPQRNAALDAMRALLEKKEQAKK